MTSSRHVYRQDYGPIYDCRPCDAYVGAYPDGTSKGTPANKEVRAARRACHNAFDPLWQSGTMNRSQAYGWLAQKMGLPRTKTHMGLFGLEQCKQVMELVQTLTIAAVRRTSKAIASQLSEEESWGRGADS